MHSRLIGVIGAEFDLVQTKQSPAANYYILLCKYTALCFIFFATADVASYATKIAYANNQCSIP